MVQVASSNTVRESRHVAIYGLPNTLSDDSLHTFFAKFGPIQRVFRRQDKKDAVVVVSYMDARAAILACKTESWFDKDTPYRITYYNPEAQLDMASSVPSTPSSIRSSSPPRTEDAPFSRLHSVPYGAVLCVIFDLYTGTTADEEVFTLVKRHTQQSGAPNGIYVDATPDPGFKKARVYFRTVDIEKLKADKTPLLGRPPKFRIYQPPRINTPRAPSHPPCAPSTSTPIKSEFVKRSYCSIHVPNGDRRRPEYFSTRFAKYGEIIDVELVVTDKKDMFAVVQFTNVDDAARALLDKEPPKPMVSPSRQANRLILFFLPSDIPQEEVMLKLRGMSDRIVNINVNWHRYCAVIEFKNCEDSQEAFKRMKKADNTLGEHTVSVDYCSPRLYEHFCKTKLKSQAAFEARRTQSPSSVASDDMRHHRHLQNRNDTSPSTLRDRVPIREPLRQKLDPHQNEERKASTSGTSSTEHSSSEHSDDDDEEEEEEDDVDGKDDSMNNGRRESLSKDMSEHETEPSTSSPSVPPDRRESTCSNKDWQAENEEEEEEPMGLISEAIELPENGMSRMVTKLPFRTLDVVHFSKRIEDITTRNLLARTNYEKMTGRPIPRYANDNEAKPRPFGLRVLNQDATAQDPEGRVKEWNRLRDSSELESFRSANVVIPSPGSVKLTQQQQQQPAASTRASLEETRIARHSLDGGTQPPHEIIQRSQSISTGPQTPITMHHPPVQPLMVNTAQTPGTSHTPAAITTPRSSQPSMIPSPVSRHGSMSSTSGRPASIQNLRHQNVIFDVSIPPPPIPPPLEELMPRDAPPARRSSETLAPLRSPPLVKPMPALLSMSLVPPPNFVAATSTGTGNHSVSSSTTSTPRHSISGTPLHYEPTTPKSQQQTPKSIRPEKIQVRHDSISKPGPSTAASALQARSQSMSVADPRKGVPPPVVRDAGSDLIDQIMSNQPSMGLKKLPRIEKKSSALLQNATAPSSSAPTAPTTPSTSSHGLFVKEKEKEKRRKERELEREREARKEMKRKETKEERHKRKEMERAKREEEERRERRREKQRMKEKEERKREKEKERRKAEKEKIKKKKKQKKDDGDDDSESISSDEIDLDLRRSQKELSQEERDHQLAIILSRGGIIENVKSRRGRTDKRDNESFEKLRQKNQNSAVQPRRVLIESSDDGADEDDGEKDKSGASSEAGSDAEQQPPPPQFLPPPPMPPTLPTAQTVKEHKLKVHKEREKGELSSTSEEEEETRGDEYHRQREKEAMENRKRQKSTTNYSSDDHSERKNAAKKKRRDDSEERMRKKTWESKEENKQRKRKMEHRRSSDDESKRSTKRDFRDVQLEDVSDEEESEDAVRVRRQSTSSNASNQEKRSVKTPLRVTTPAVTPLQSPKILSPKISMSKRPSISEESLTSPKPRIRTVSSTSTTTTTSSRPEAVPEKALSPTVTAKSSVSSIDDLAIREDLSATSAADSPMSTTGRPMVLTKAAMKAFHSSPPKKPSYEHESSSSPASSSSSPTPSSRSSSSLSEDNSDEETIQEPVGVVATPESSASSLLIPPPPIPPLMPPPPPPPPPPVIMAVESEPVAELPRPPTPPVIPAQISPVLAEQESVEQEVPTEDKEEEEKKETVVESEEKVSESSDKPSPPTNDVSIPTDEVENVEESQEVQKAQEVQETQEVTPYIEPVAAHPTHSLISDQETDQAVQSIFDEEAEEDFPQYPDFVMPKEQKEEPDREPSVSLADFEEVVPKDEKLSPNANTTPDHQNCISPENQTEDVAVVEDSVMNNEEENLLVPEAEVPIEQVEQEVVVEAAVPLVPEKELTPERERTPTPELIPNDSSNRVEQNYEQIEAPIQTPLEISTTSLSSPHSIQHSIQQLVQPSPRPAAAPEPQAVVGQPVSVVQQPRLEKPSPRGASQTPFVDLTPDQFGLLERARHFMVNTSARHLIMSNPKLLESMIELLGAIPLLPPDVRQFRHECQEQLDLAKQQEKKTAEERELRRLKEDKPTTLSNLKDSNPWHFMSDDAADILNDLNLKKLVNFASREQQRQNNGHVSNPFHLLRPESSVPLTQPTPSRTPLQPSSSTNQSAVQANIPNATLIHHWFYEHHPMMWSGRLALKSMDTLINLHMVHGSEAFLQNVLGKSSLEEQPHRETVRITQRLRLDNGQVEHIHRILTNPDYACCIGLASVTDVNNFSAHESTLKSSIDYLKNKQIAGISCLENDSTLNSARVHVFAPGELVMRYLCELAPNLYNYLHNSNTCFLFIVFTNDKSEPNMPSPPPVNGGTTIIC